MFRMLIHPLVVVQPALGYHITNSQSRYITPARLKSAQYSLHNNAPSSRNLLKMDVLTSEKCWAVNWHNKASVIKLVYLYSNIKMMHGPIHIRLVFLVRDSGDKELRHRIAPRLLFPNLIQILLMSVYSISRPLIQIPKCACLRYVSLPTHHFGIVMFLKMYSVCFSLNTLKTKNSSDYKCV